MVAEGVGDLHISAGGVDFLMVRMRGDRDERRALFSRARNVAGTQGMTGEQRGIETGCGRALLHDAGDLVRAQPATEHPGAAHAAEHRARCDLRRLEPPVERLHRVQLAPMRDRLGAAGAAAPFDKGTYRMLATPPG
jgi:hypothetical protein